jgi:AraC-like DNA-binding protein
MTIPRQFQEIERSGLDEIRYIDGTFSCLEKLLGLTISIHDVSGSFLNQDGESLLTWQRQRHMHPYCGLGRAYRLNEVDQHCVQECKMWVNRQMRLVRAPAVHTCWRGVTQYLIPLEQEGIWIGTLFAGPFRKTEPSSLLPKLWCRLHSELPRFDESRSCSIVDLLVTFAKGITSYVDEFLHQKYSPIDRRQMIRRFFHYKASEHDISLKDLATVLFLSPSRTSHVVRDIFGISFQEMLLQERIKKARYLFENTPLTLAQVAELTGFSSEYYLSRIFKKRLGVSPAKYRHSIAAKVTTAPDLKVNELEII